MLLLQGDVPTEDLIFGAVVLLIFAPIIFGAGYLLTRFKNARFARAWVPLVPVLQGAKIAGDGGGAATSWLTGTYKGMEVRASMAPNISVYGNDHHGNQFEIVLLAARGREDWTLGWGTAFLGFGPSGWRIRGASRDLAERLRAAGVVDSIDRLGFSAVSYRAKSGELQFREDVAPLWAPPPERFREELDTLMGVAAVNARENPA